MDHRRLERLIASLHHLDGSTSILHRLCVVTAESANVDGSGVSQMIDGRHEIVTSSSPTAAIVEVLQVELAEGPCIEVFSSCKPFLEPDLASPRARRRWPQFAPQAAEQGVAAVFAFPLIVGGVATAVLDLYCGEARDLGNDELADALLLADLASLTIGSEGGRAGIDEVGLHLEALEPWAHGAVVHNATGVVAVQLNIGVDEAVLRLRAVAFMTERPLAEVSRDVVERRLRLESWSLDG
ncbi:MAG: GAF and ANTAR domain-containing protein [Ilumatobacteraceae bacterium]